MEKTIDPAHEIGENVTITDRSQLLSITPEQAKKIKSLRIENQMFDGSVTLFSVFSDNNLKHIHFDGCSFLGAGLWILSIFPSASRIGFTRCGLSCDSLEQLLYSSNPYEELEVLDVSGNNFGNPVLFVDVLKRTIFRAKSLKTLVISENGFDPMIVPLIKEVGGSDIGEIVL